MKSDKIEPGVRDIREKEIWSWSKGYWGLKVGAFPAPNHAQWRTLASHASVFSSFSPHEELSAAIPLGYGTSSMAELQAIHKSLEVTLQIPPYTDTDCPYIYSRTDSTPDQSFSPPLPRERISS